MHQRTNGVGTLTPTTPPTGYVNLQHDDGVNRRRERPCQRQRRQRVNEQLGVCWSGGDDMNRNDILAVLALVVAVTSAPWFFTLLEGIMEVVSFVPIELVVSAYAALWVTGLNIWMTARMEARLSERLNDLEKGIPQ